MTIFSVTGIPRAQGSKSAFKNKHTGKVVMTEGGTNESRANFAAWRDSVSEAARKAHGGAPPLDGPLRVRMRFVFPRPSGARKADHWKPTAPDIDKLQRAVLDCLTAARVIVDDARVACVEVSKELADAAGRQPIGCSVEVTPVPPWA